MSETKSSTIGHALVAMYGNLRTEFRLGFNGEFVFGDFNPSADFDPVDSDPKRFAAAFRARYGVDRLGTVGEWLNGKNFYPDVIEFLLYHPDNPLDLTPEAIRSLKTPPINGTREWMVARQDCCCVMVAGIPSMEALEMLAKALGYGAAPQPAPVAPAQSDDDLSISIVFDGPPGPVSGRFVEVEDGSGRSIILGRWHEDGEYWRLVIGRADVAQFFGHPVSAAPQPERTAPAATSALPLLAPVEQRAAGVAYEAGDAWNRSAPAWARQIIPGSFVGDLAESVARIAIPIWRRAQERIAQRTAEILREGGK